MHNAEKKRGDLKLVRVPERETAYHDWEHDNRYYQAYVSGELIGHIEARRTESWRKAGRLRTSLIGRPRHWQGYLLGRNVTGPRHTRSAALDCLLDVWEEPDHA